METIFGNNFSNFTNVKRLFKFSLVGSLGIIINTLIFSWLNNLGVHYLLSAAVATEIAIISNFVGNNIFTFNDRLNDANILQKFASFQLISLVTLLGTLLILWSLETKFGIEHLLAWNIIAILSMFILNFILNYYITWPISDSKKRIVKKFKIRKSTLYKLAKTAGFSILFSVMLFSVNAQPQSDIVAVSHMGYHPSSAKQVVVYTNSQSGSFDIKSASNNQIVASYTLQKAKDYNGNAVECQGNLPCIVGDFSGFSEEGEFYVDFNGIESKNFKVGKNIFEQNIDVFSEFFNAQLQQNSDYHGDMHLGYNPELNLIADGSFILEADQAALPLIRLGSAYRRNPTLFQFDNYDILASNKPDIQEYILSYVRYLEGLQGAVVTENNAPNAVRLGSGMKIDSAFVPGPTSMQSLDVYIPGDPPQFLQTVPVRSLCGNDDGSGEWDNCIRDAQFYYKCQINEPCLELSYIDKIGVISKGNGFGISRGWGYEFGCFFDVDLQNGVFNDKPNPCHIFYGEESRKYTALALLGFLEAYPAVKDFSSQEGVSLLDRSINTYNYIKATYAPFSSSTVETPIWGAALFLLHDYTGDVAYLQEAHSLQSLVGTAFAADATRGNEFYWEEYIRHKDDISSSGLQYLVDGNDPSEYFRGQMFHDYKDEGIFSIGSNGEKVFQKYRDTNFQNSRQILTMGLLAAKTLELHPSIEQFVKSISDNQLSWMTGMNAVQKGTSYDSPLQSYSFIFGIGDHPKQFHSRYLIDTAYASQSDGTIIGARGTNYQFFDSDQGKYIFLDGKTTILGETLGAMGNLWQDETNLKPYQLGKEFKNGKDFIPGWINGAFDTSADNDYIFNYNDNLDAYEYTETTNEMVATAIELFSYLDAQMNNRPRHDGSVTNISINSTSDVGSLNVTTTPTLAEVYLDNQYLGATDQNGKLQAVNIAAGAYVITASKLGFQNYSQVIQITSGSTLSVSITLVPSSNATSNSTNSSSSLAVSTNPGLVDIYLDMAFIGTTDVSGDLAASNLVPGDHLLVADREGYALYQQQITLIAGSNQVGIIMMPSSNVTNSTASIIGSGTSLKGAANSNKGVVYTMIENGNASFWIRSNGFNNIIWYVNDIEVKQTFSKESELFWIPGILHVPRAPDYSNIAQSTIKAVSPNETIIWRIDVENIVNPFFTSIDGTSDVIGSESSVVHVFTNDKLVKFAKVNVTLKSTEGNNNILTTYELTINYQGNNETDWSKALSNLPYGNTYISKITGATANGKIYEYSLGEERAHYRTVPFTQSQSSNDDRPSSSASSSSRYVAAVPQLVYTSFEKGIIGINETQTLILDAKNFNGGIHKVQALIIPPSGSSITLDLNRVRGSQEYGTWQSDFKGFKVSGIYILHSVSLGRNGTKMTEISVENRSFYVVADIVGANEKLMLVYSTLSQNSAKNGTNITLSVDARDVTGVASVSAKIKAKNLEFSIPLKLVKGNKNYGTWQGSFQVTQPDSTYSIATITLQNEKESKTYEIKDRSVYVQWVAPSLGSFADLGPKKYSKEYFVQLIKEPLIPTFIGFGLMLLVMGALMVSRSQKNINKNIDKQESSEE